MLERVSRYFFMRLRHCRLLPIGKSRGLDGTLNPSLINQLLDLRRICATRARGSDRRLQSVGRSGPPTSDEKRRFAGQMYESILDLIIYAVVLALVAFGYRKLLHDGNDQP